MHTQNIWGSNEVCMTIRGKLNPFPYILAFPRMMTVIPLISPFRGKHSSKSKNRYKIRAVPFRHCPFAIFTFSLYREGVSPQAPSGKSPSNKVRCIAGLATPS